MTRVACVAAALGVPALVACRSSADATPRAADASASAPSASPAPTDTVASRLAQRSSRPVHVVDAPPDGPVGPAVQAALERARAGGERLVVYVGATWCEPCQRFHHAAEAGELDAQLPGLTLLAFDLDRDRDRLIAAGYQSKYIPLFALPGSDGMASGMQIEGGIKGDGAVGYIVPRLQALLAK